METGVRIEVGAAIDLQAGTGIRERPAPLPGSRERIQHYSEVMGRLFAGPPCRAPAMEDCTVYAGKRPATR
jgi:hypothetical protein